MSLMPQTRAISSLKFLMNEEEIVEKLSVISYPIEDNGWIKRTQNGLPSYRILRKSLAAKNSKTTVLMDKVDCVNSIGSSPMQSDGVLEEKTNDYLFSQILRMAKSQRRIISEIKATTPALIDQIEGIVKQKESSVVKKQIALKK